LSCSRPEALAPEKSKSRQETEAASTPRIGLAVERYLAGVRQEKEVGRGRFLGVALLGLTRVVPDGLGADERFTVALGLGLKWPLTPRLGLRVDVLEPDAGPSAFSSAGSADCERSRPRPTARRSSSGWNDS
jgi:hypothetical protein